MVALTTNKQNNMKNAVVFLILIALGIGYLVWLDSGCKLSGVMTWHGKECIN